jgi:hypothetical protein
MIEARSDRSPQAGGTGSQLECGSENLRLVEELEAEGA